MASTTTTTTASLIALSAAAQLTAYTRFVLLLRIFNAETSTIRDKALQLSGADSRGLLNAHLEDVAAKLDLINVYLAAANQTDKMTKDEREELELLVVELTVMEMQLQDVIEEFQMRMLRFGWRL